MKDYIDNTLDIIDIRDIIARIEYLEDVLPASDEANGEDNVEREELASLADLMDALRGSGADQEWREYRYPLLLVRDSYFEDFAREEAKSLGLINDEVSWPYDCIEWEKAARTLRFDYTSVEFDRVTYWYR